MIDGIAERVRGREGDIVVVLGRGSVAESPTATMQAAAALAALPNVRFLSALRRGNVHGALDCGLAPNFLPGRVTLAEGRAWYAERWDTLPTAPGLDTEGILRAVADGRIHVLVLLGADPIADFPDAELARRALDGAGFVIAIDAFLSESSRRADVLLPCTLWGEKRGTSTNLEFRRQRLGQKVSPEGVAMDDWRIAGELALRLGVDFDLESPDEVADEMARVAPSQLGATAALLGRARDGLLLPLADHLDQVVLRTGDLSIMADDGQGTSWDPIKVEGATPEEVDDDADSSVVATADAVAHTEAAPALYTWTRDASGADVPARDAYALRLVSTRRLYDAGRAVSESPILAGLREPAVLRVNPHDLERIGVANGDRVNVASARSALQLPIEAAASVPVGVAHLAFSADGQGAAALIDPSQPVIDLRVETIA